IPLSFVFAKRLFGARVGLVLAALVTFSTWDIEFSRYARMYAPFEFLYLLTLLLIWRYRVVEESLAGGVLALAAALAALSLHDLGYSLALAFFVPVAMQGRAVLSAPRKLVFPGAAFTVIAAAFVLWQRLQSRNFHRAERLAAGSSDEGAASPIPGLADASEPEPTGLVERLLEPVRLP